jgi:benzoyl-CoA reductase/2-hydroxyglutaryl-CoA dehydratase subunit BcrC/BadD/HgdB
MTNESIDFDKVKEKMRLVNEVKEIAALIFHRYFKKGYVPFQWPVSLMFHGAYTDYLSDLVFFKEKLRLLIAEIDSNIRKGLVLNYKQEHIPRILFVGGPGLDPVLAQTIQKQGGCLLYIDIFPNSLRHQLIDLSGDFILKYGQYMLGKANFVKGIEDSMRFWLKQASMLDVEGIVFCETWACRFIAPGYRYFKDRVRDELGIPVVNVAFNDLGENAGQITTRIEALMEMLR